MPTLRQNVPGRWTKMKVTVIQSKLGCSPSKIPKSSDLLKLLDFVLLGHVHRSSTNF